MEEVGTKLFSKEKVGSRKTSVCVCARMRACVCKSVCVCMHVCSSQELFLKLLGVLASPFLFYQVGGS